MITYKEAAERTLADLKKLKTDISLDHLDLRTSGGGTIYVNDVKDMLDVLFDRIKRIEDGVQAMNRKVELVLVKTSKRNIEGVSEWIDDLTTRIESLSGDLEYCEDAKWDLEHKVDELEDDLREAEDENPEVGFQFRTGGR